MLLLAVWTRLELATPCVTGRYSNQLNYQTVFPKKQTLHCSRATAKIHRILFSAMLGSFFFGRHSQPAQIHEKSLETYGFLSYIGALNSRVFLPFLFSVVFLFNLCALIEHANIHDLFVVRFDAHNTIVQ